MPTEAQARYNFRCSWGLLLLNAGLLMAVLQAGLLSSYFDAGAGGWLLLPALPGSLALLAGAAARSLPAPRRAGLYLVAVAGLLLALVLGAFSFWASHFLQGKW